MFAKILARNRIGEVEPLISVVLVDKNTPGVTVGPPLDSMTGLKGLEVSEVRFNDVKVPKENLVGAHGDATNILQDLVLETRIYQAVQMAAVMR